MLQSTSEPSGRARRSCNPAQACRGSWGTIEVSRMPAPADTPAVVFICFLAQLALLHDTLQLDANFAKIMGHTLLTPCSGSTPRSFTLHKGSLKSLFADCGYRAASYLSDELRVLSPSQLRPTTYWTDTHHVTSASPASRRIQEDIVQRVGSV